MNGTPAKYATVRQATKYLQRLRIAYSDKKFEMLQHPTDFGWAIAIMRDRCGRPVAWVETIKGPLPGELGFVPMETWQVEYTDTYGGEANYSWVQRKTIQMKANTKPRSIMRKAKAAVGLTGVKGKTYWNTDTGEFTPYRMATRLFVTFDDIASN